MIFVEVSLGVSVGVEGASIKVSVRVSVEMRVPVGGEDPSRFFVGWWFLLG